MLVKELIQKLQALPQDAVVLIDTDKNLHNVDNNIEMQDVVLFLGKYLPMNMLYESQYHELQYFKQTAVVLELS